MQLLQKSYHGNSMPPEKWPKNRWFMSPYCCWLYFTTLQYPPKFSHGFCRGLSQSPAPQRCEVGSSPNFRFVAKVTTEGPHDTHGGMENHYTWKKKWSTLKHRLKTCPKSEKSGSEKVAADSACTTYNQKLTDHYVLQNAIWLKNLRSYFRNVREFC